MAHQSSFLEIAPLLLHILLAALTNLITYPFRTTRCSTLSTDMLYAGVRAMLERATIAQLRYLMPSTTAQYTAYCQRNSLPQKSVAIRGIKAHWIGSPDARRVVLYLHGGGYTQPAGEMYFAYLHRLAGDLNESDEGRMSVLMPAYTLVPEARYPSQLREAAAALAYLLDETGRTPADIIIAGDSAGGNLVLSLLSHLLHTHPDVLAIKLSGPLGGVVLYSPWTSFSTEFHSFANVNLDVLPPLMLRRWAAMFLDKSHPTDPELDPGLVEGDSYTEACINPSSWWEGMHCVVSDVFVSYGGHEVLKDSIKMWEERLKKSWVQGGGDESRVVFVEEQGKAHIPPIMDMNSLGWMGKSEVQRAVEEWYRARVGV